MKFYSIKNLCRAIFSTKKIRVLLVSIVALAAIDGYSQRIAIKTDAAEWLTVSPNLSAEFVLSQHYSLDFAASFNAWSPYKNLQLDHFSASPELRYWISRPMTGHFFGLTALYVNYDFMFKTKGYQGQTLGAGLSYGYCVVLSERWNVEVSAGVGAMYKWQYRYVPGEKVENASYNDFGWVFAPVDFGVTFSYILF